jgi:hypothetical protein
MGAASPYSPQGSHSAVLNENPKGSGNRTLPPNSQLSSTW